MSLGMAEKKPQNVTEMCESNLTQDLILVRQVLGSRSRAEKNPQNVTWLNNVLDYIDILVWSPSW